MKRTVASNVPRYFVYTALKGFGFGLFLAVWVIYLQGQRGLSLSQAALIDVTFFAVFGRMVNRLHQVPIRRSELSLQI